MESYERIRYLRKLILNMTLKDFSDKISISRSNLGNIEKGRIRLTERVLSDICRIFRVNPNWILNGDDPVFVKENDLLVDEISRLYSSLTNENQNYLICYTQQLLDEQMETQNKE